MTETRIPARFANGLEMVTPQVEYRVSDGLDVVFGKVEVECHVLFHEKPFLPRTYSLAPRDWSAASTWAANASRSPAVGSRAHTSVPVNSSA